MYMNPYGRNSINFKSDFTSNYPMNYFNNFSRVYMPPQMFPLQNMQIQKSISFKEGVGLVLRGIKDKAVGMVKSIIRHPIKALATMAVSTAALAALPFLGISMATGGAAMVVAFGGLAIFNTAKNLYNVRKNNKKGNFNEARKNLTNLGGNIVDLALTLPFMPKAIKHLKRNVPLYINRNISSYKHIDGSIDIRKKYFGGTANYKYNSDGTIKSIDEKQTLFSKVKEAKTWKERIDLITEQDRKEIMYEQINKAYRQVAKERNIYSAEDINFYSKPMEVIEVRNPKTGKIELVLSKNGACSHVEKNSINSNKININIETLRDDYIPNKKGTGSTDFNEMIKTVGHEHRHVEQNDLLARAEELRDKHFDLRLSFNKDVKKKGLIKKGSHEWELANEYYKAANNYTEVNSAENISVYENNLLEVDANTVGKTEVANQIMSKLRSNMGIDASKQITGISAKYNPTKDIIIVNGLPIVNSSKNNC